MIQQQNNPTSLAVKYLSFELIWNFFWIVWLCNLNFLTKCLHAEVSKINYLLFEYFYGNWELLLMKIYLQKRQRGFFYGLAKHQKSADQKGQCF